MKKTLPLAIVLLGLAAMICQVTLIREFLVVFHGNELSIGITMGSWLLMVGVGGWLYTRFIDRSWSNIRLFILMQITSFLLFLLDLFLIRGIRTFFAEGEIIGATHILYLPLLILAPICLVFGMQFTLGCSLLCKLIGRDPERIGEVYVYDAAGDIIGGLLFTYLLAYFLHPVHIVFLVGLISLSSAFILTPKEKNTRRMLTGTLIVILLLLSLSPAPEYLRDASLGLEWRGYNLIRSEDSIYGNIAVTKEGDQYSFYQDGILAFTTQQEFYNEMLIHTVMLEHPDPEKVLLIGGGVSGALSEILKHPVEHVDYVELDSTLVEVAKEYIPERDEQALNNPNISVWYQDGRAYIKNATATYDVVIINLPDPYNAQLNRFYTREFFQEVRSVVNNGSIVSVGLTSSENYVSREMQRMNSEVYRTLKDVFPQAIVIPGEHIFLLASPGANLTYDYRIMEERLEARQIENEFLNQYYLPYLLSEERVNFTLEMLKTEDTGINHDLHPTTYYYNLLVWASMFHPQVSILDSLPDMAGWWPVMAVMLFILLMPLTMSARNRARKTYVTLAIITTGFASMSLQLVLMLSFQAFHGYLYHQIGALTASFMLGLVVGGSIMNKKIGQISSKTFLLIGIEILLIVYALFLPATIAQPAIHLGPGTSLAIFYILAIIVGALTGAEFPLANHLKAGDNIAPEQTGGKLYGADLIGACTGAFITSAMIIPLLGIINACMAIMSLKAISLLLILIPLIITRLGRSAC